MRLTLLFTVIPLLACDSDPDGNTGPCGGVAGCPPDITILTMDENGEQVTADEVYWYFEPDSAEYDGEHAVDCGDIHCTLWEIATAPGEFFYVAGNRAGPEHEDPACFWSGYDGQPVDFSEGAVTLALDLSLQESCE